MGTFRVIRNQSSSIVENAYEILSILSTFVIHGLPSFGGQGANLQFGHLFNQEWAVIDAERKATMASVEITTK